MATYTNLPLFTQPTAAATIETYNNHRKLFVDSTGRYWYVGFEQRASEPITPTIETIDAWYADDPSGPWTQEPLWNFASHGGGTGSDLNASFAEANNGDIVVWVNVTTVNFGTNDSWRIFRRDVGTGLWSAVGTLAVPAPFNPSRTAISKTNFALFNHPDDSDTWIAVFADRNGGGTENLSYAVSTNNMTSWGSTVVIEQVTGNGDVMGDRNGLIVATTNGFRTLYLFYVASNISDELVFRRLSNWDASVQISAKQIIDTRSSSQQHYQLAGAFSATDTFQLIYQVFDGSFTNYTTRHRQITVLGGTIVVGGETSIVNTMFQQAGPFGAYDDADGLYHFWWMDNADAGFHAVEGGPFSESIITGVQQTMRGLSNVNNYALDEDFAGIDPPGGQRRGSFLVTYGLAPTGSFAQYSLTTSSDAEFFGQVTTLPPTTPPPTLPPFTGPTSPPPSTPAPSTSPPLTVPPGLTDKIRSGFTFRRGFNEVFARATMVSASGDRAGTVLDPVLCTAEIFGESDSLGVAAGSDDPAGPDFVRFRIAGVSPLPSHVYVLRVSLVRFDGVPLGTRDFPMATS